VSFNDWILSLHVLSAVALMASMVLFWILVVATRPLTDVDQRIAPIISFGLGRPSWAAAHPYYEHLCPDPTPPPGFLSRTSGTPV
jgi:hypothetical protein